MRLLAIFTLCATIIMPVASDAAVPSMLNYQGRLTNGGDNPQVGTFNVTFSIYDAQTGGSALWTESQNVTTDTQGRFNVLLGSTNALTNNVFSGVNRYLGTAVASDPEMTPRTPLAASPYASRVATVDGAAGGALTYGLDMPYNTSALNGNNGGLRWRQGANAQSAFGFTVYDGVWFQGSYDLGNEYFGVRAPTADASLGPAVLSISSAGNIYTSGTINSSSISCDGTIHANYTITTDGLLSAGGGIATTGGISGGNIYGADFHAGGTIYAGNNVCCSSDSCFKKSVETISDAVTAIQQLRGVRYEWRRDEFPDRKFAEGPQVGLIAQEVREVVPQAVIEQSDGYLAVDYARLVPLLIESIKEQQRRIEALEKKLDQQTP